MKIYTKTGDKGKTSLLGGVKVSKADLRLEAYGTTDELNSYIGLVNDYQADEATQKLLKEVQDRIFTIGSELACDPAKQVRMAIPDLHEEDISKLEGEIDRMTAELPAMKSFILPGGAPAVSFIHVARCVCRRAERAAVRLDDHNGKVPPLIIKYLNRLSDYLFVLARYTGHRMQIPEIPWKARV